MVRDRLVRGGRHVQVHLSGGWHPAVFPGNWPGAMRVAPDKALVLCRWDGHLDLVEALTSGVAWPLMAHGMPQGCGAWAPGKGDRVQPVDGHAELGGRLDLSGMARPLIARHKHP